MNVLSDKIICVLGGTGFVGRYIIQALAREGYRVKVLTRHAQKAYFLRTYGVVGQIVPVEAETLDDFNLTRHLRGAHAVINCVAIRYETRKQKFQQLHTDLPALLGKICREENIAHLVHISALACTKGTSQYARTKAAGEIALHREFPYAVILRPSVIFGQEDEFFNTFAGLMSFVPFLPLIGGGGTRFQPVYVDDVAKAAIAALDVKGGIYELAGPETVSFKDIYKKIFTWTGKQRALIPLSWPLAKIKGSILSLLPNPILTPDNVEALKTDNVISGEQKTLSDLGITPTSMDLVVPQYLSRFRPGGRFGDKNKEAA